MRRLLTYAIGVWRQITFNGRPRKTNSSKSCATWLNRRERPLKIGSSGKLECGFTRPTKAAGHHPSQGLVRGVPILLV